MKAPRWTVLLAVAVMAAILIAIASAASDRSTKSEAAHAGPYKIALSNSFIGNTWRIEMENLFKAGCKMPPYKTQVDVLGLQLGQRRQQADAADLQPDLPGRRRDRHRRRLAHRPQRHHQAGLRPRHPRRLVRQRRHRPVRLNGQHRPVQVRRAARPVPGRQAARQGQRDHGHRRRRHVRRRRAQQGRRRRLQEVPGHQGRRPLHRQLGLLGRAAQHRRSASVAAEDRRHLGARAAPTAC